MTDPRHPQRTDLSALTPDDATRERIMVAALARARQTPQLIPDGVDVFVRRALRPALVVASALMAAAACAVLFIRSEADTPAAVPVSAVTAWVDDSHVPTNGELLAAFRGYGQ